MSDKTLYYIGLGLQIGSLVVFYIVSVISAYFLGRRSVYVQKLSDLKEKNEQSSSAALHDSNGKVQ